MKNGQDRCLETMGEKRKEEDRSQIKKDQDKGIQQKRDGDKEEKIKVE